MLNTMSKNSDLSLENGANNLREERKKLGLEGLTGGLEFVIINTENGLQESATSKIISSTGFCLTKAFEDERFKTFVLSTTGSADIIVRSRKSNTNPFLHLNIHPKSKSLPNTRLETFVFRSNDLEKYVSIQKSRGIRFMDDDILRTDKFMFIQTEPSTFTGNSIGFIEWKNTTRDYIHSNCREIHINVEKPDRKYLKNIKHLDHIATRVTATNRDPAIMEFMKLTDYNFEISIYIDELNSITNVARLTPKDFALVFTSGIAPYISDTESGPTEKFVHNYGARVHHMAFHTEHIEETYDLLARDGIRYLINLVGSENEGLKQTFTVPFTETMIINEYIHRYGDFDGFFTKSNVRKLTAASDYVPND